MPEHYRPNGKIGQGYFCMTCGKECSMMGHKNCEPNEKLVLACIAANRTNSKPRFNLGLK
jgi:hypothetical protein